MTEPLHPPSGAPLVEVRFSPPPCIDSPLSRLDGRWRLAALLLAMLAAAVPRSLVSGLVAMAGSAVLALLARLPARWFRQRLLALAIPLAFFIVPLPLLTQEWGEGVRLAGLFAIKGVTLATLAAVLLVSAPLDASLKAAHALFIPGLLVQLALLSYRYLFVLGDELARLRIALRVRGFRNRANAHSYRTVGQAAGTLLIRGHERAERVAQAMRCRAFDGRFRSLAAFRTRWMDVLALMLVSAGAVGIVGLDVLLCSR
jgi:cobalt/nickel transport system permease protein